MPPQETLEKFDQDHSGGLRFEELRRFLKHLDSNREGSEPSEDEVKWVIQMCTPEKQLFNGEWVRGDMQLEGAALHVLSLPGWQQPCHRHCFVSISNCPDTKYELVLSPSISLSPAFCVRKLRLTERLPQQKASAIFLVYTQTVGEISRYFEEFDPLNTGSINRCLSTCFH